MRSRSIMLLALTLFACQHGGGGGGGGSPVLETEAASKYANLYCNLIETCDCDTQISVTQCVDESTNEFQASLDAALMAGLIYHADCMGTYLGYLEDFGCVTASEVVDNPMQIEGATHLYDCKPLSGNGNVGDACTNFYETIFADSCMQGLICSNSVCIDAGFDNPNDGKQVGEVCDPQTEFCVDGAVCTSSMADPMTYTCVDLPSVGQSCMQTYYCDDGSWCDSTDYMCKAPVGAGEACDPFGAECQETLFCDDTSMTCVTRLAEGLACDNDGQCMVGLECDTADTNPGICVAEEPLVCGGQ
jgi:hypothetical protein